MTTEASQLESLPPNGPNTPPLIKEWYDFFDRVTPWGRSLVSLFPLLVLLLRFGLIYAPYITSDGPIYTSEWLFLSYTTFIPFVVCCTVIQWLLINSKEKFNAVVALLVGIEKYIRMVYGTILFYYCFQVTSFYFYYYFGYENQKEDADSTTTLLWYSYANLILGGFVYRCNHIYYRSDRYTLFNILPNLCGDIPVFILFMGLRHHAFPAVIPWVLSELLIALMKCCSANPAQNKVVVLINNVIYTLRYIWFLNNLVFGKVEMLSAKYPFVAKIWYLSLPLLSIKWFIGGGYIVLIALAIFGFITYRVLLCTFKQQLKDLFKYLIALGTELKEYKSETEAQNKDPKSHPFYPKNINTEEDFDDKGEAVEVLSDDNSDSKTNNDVVPDHKNEDINVKESDNQVDTSMGSTRNDSAKDSQQLTCKICYDKTACILIEPCCHMALCEECLNKYINHNTSDPNSKVYNSCPICRGPIKQTRKVFL